MAAGTSAVAVIGAITGVASLGWQIFRYIKEGPILRLSITQDHTWDSWVSAYPQHPITVLSIANVGSQATQLDGLVVRRYRHRYSRFFRQAPVDVRSLPIPENSPLPCKLAVGDAWTGLLDQASLGEFRAGGGYLYVGIHHAFAKEPKLTRLKPASKVGPSEEQSQP